MVRALSPAPIVYSDTHIIGVCGVGGELLAALGRKPYRDGTTLLDAVMHEPQLLRSWAASRTRAPQNQEQCIFAKLMLATLDATEIIDVGTLGRARQNPATVPAEPRGYTEPVMIHRAVIAMSGPPYVATQSAITSRLIALWTWAPHVVGFSLLCVVWCFLSKPELIAIVPVKLVGWIPLYLAWAGNRILTRLEFEVQGWFSQSWPLHALSAPESDHGHVGPGAPSMQLHAAPGGLIPWLVAGYMAWRQQ